MTGSASTQVQTVTIPGTTPSGALLYFGAMERDGGVTLGGTPVSDNINGTTGWTEISEATGDGQSWFFYRQNSGTGSITVSIDFGSAKTARLVAGFCTGASTTAALNTFDATPAANASGTAHASDNVTPSANGIALGFLGLSGDQAVTAVGTSETEVTNEDFAAHIISQAASNGVAVGLSATLDGNRASNFHIAVFAEAGGGGGGGPPPQNLMLPRMGGGR
jgi:hypothetical protein